MSCEDCGDDLSVNDGDPVTEITITGDDSQVIVDPVTLEIDVCDDEVGLVEVDGGIVLFEEDAEVEVLVFDDVLEILECGETTSSGGGAVDSVNGETGVVVLDAGDVGADVAGAAGQALTDANNYTDTQIGSLGFLESIVPGAGVTVDDTDPQNPIISATALPDVIYFLQDQETTSTYAYVGYESADNDWYIYRRTRATNVREYATGASSYATNWTNRGSLTYV